MVTQRLKIAGSRALVTGASRGIGADLARGLRRSGATVALVARPSNGLFALADELGAAAYPTDLTDHHAVGGLLDLVEADGPIDILVNNAGDEKVGRFDEMSSDTLDFILDLNVRAVVELTRQAVPRMAERSRGHVVNISSFGGVICPPNLAVYAATKAFITHLTVNLAAEFHDSPVGFTKVEIGEVSDTGLMEKGRTDPVFTALVQRLYRLHLSRLISPAEITNATLAAIENGRLSVRLPRRIGISSYLADAPRALSILAARDLRRKQLTEVVQ
ncbi:SDR family NAD(P)-dependent oxidoreductase [Mycobacterium sp. C31M]